MNESYSLKFCYVHTKFKEKINVRSCYKNEPNRVYSFVNYIRHSPQSPREFNPTQRKVSKVLNYVTTRSSVSLFRWLLDMCTLVGWLAGWRHFGATFYTLHSPPAPLSTPHTVTITPPGYIDHTQNSSTVINVCLFLASLMMEIADAATSSEWGTL